MKLVYALVVGLGFASFAEAQTQPTIDSTPQKFLNKDLTDSSNKIPSPTPTVNLCTYPGIDGTGATDSRAGFVNALAAVAGTNAALDINCPVYISIGQDSTKIVYVSSNTNVNFGPKGKLLVDNIGVPFLAFINAHDANWYNTQISYIPGTSPSTTGSFGQNCYNYPSGTGSCQTTINNSISALTAYETANFNTIYTGGGTYFHSGLPQVIAEVMISGLSYRVKFVNTTISVPDGVTASAFIPNAVSINPSFSPNTTIAGNPILSPSNSSTPDQIVFDGLTIDGALMGIQSIGGTNVQLLHVHSIRYSDLQDDSGGNVGGVTVWFPPPHLIYNTSYPSNNTTLYTGNIKDVRDDGVYVGATTRRARGSGPLNSIKVDPFGGLVIDGYVSNRPDGGMTLQNQAGNTNPSTISNVVINFNSATATADAGTVPGLEFIGIPACVNLAMKGVVISDLNPSVTGLPPWQTGTQAGSQDCSFTDIKIYIKDWATGNTNSFVSFGGNRITVDMSIWFDSDSSTQTGRGFVNGAGNLVLTDSRFEVKLHGWRHALTTFTGALSTSAVSATLASNWAFTSGTYATYFSSGDIRYVVYTNGATTATWTGGLSAGATATAYSNIVAGNFSQYKPRFLISRAGNTNQGSAIGNYAKVSDYTNGITQELSNGILSERWCQFWSGTPTGSTFPIPGMTFPSTMAIDGVGYDIGTALDTTNSLTTQGVGWSGGATSILAAQPVTAGQVAIPVFTPISLGGSNRSILLTPTSGTYGTTGWLMLSVCATQQLGPT